MQWTQKGAHLLLQARPKVLDGDLEGVAVPGDADVVEPPVRSRRAGSHGGYPAVHGVETMGAGRKIGRGLGRAADARELRRGGLINPDLLRQSAAARNFARAFDLAQKPIATICHGPWVLASAGLTKGRTMTSWPGIRDDIVNAGATWLDQEVVRDGNWVSSRGPQDLVPFIREITELFSEAGPIPVEAPRRAASSPPGSSRA